MKQIRQKLSILLAVQLVLASALWAWAHQSNNSQAGQKPLLSFDSSKVDKVMVKRQDLKLEMVKTKDGWRMPGFHNLPVDNAKLDQLLKDLSNMKSTELVATTAASHDRLQVTDDKPMAEVQLFSGEKPTALLRVGKSPTFGKQYVRAGDSPEVHTVKWNAYVLQATGTSWFDRQYLASGSVKELDLPHFSLTADKGVWKSGDHNLNQTKVKSLVDAVEHLEVFDLAKSDLKPDFNLTAVKADGSKVEYRFAQKGDEYFVQRAGDDVWFKLAKEKAEKLCRTSLADLVQAQPAAAKPQPTKAASKP